MPVQLECTSFSVLSGSDQLFFQGLIRANEEFVAEVERLYGEEERWEGRLEDFFVEKFRLGSVKGETSGTKAD